MPVATLTGLTVRYGSKTAVNDLSVDVPEGCVGLLDPNGAGKSTVLKTLLGFLKPSAGGGSVLGLDITTQRRDDMLELIRSVSHGKGINVIVSSHLLPDIERTCDMVIVMRKGQIATQGSVAALRTTVGIQIEAELRVPSPAFVTALEKRG